MVKILNTTKGWCYQSNTEVAYYKTLHEVMAAAYAKEFKSTGNSKTYMLKLENPEQETYPGL